MPLLHNGRMDGTCQHQIKPGTTRTLVGWRCRWCHDVNVGRFGKYQGHGVVRNGGQVIGYSNEMILKICYNLW